MILIKILVFFIVAIGSVWMMMNEDEYVDKTHSLQDDTISFEQWKEQLYRCETQSQAVNWYRERPFTSDKVRHAFYDKMQDIEKNEKLKRETLSLN